MTTAFVKSNRLLASVPSPLVAQPGVAQVAVVNPNKQVSNEFPFDVVEGLVITTSALLPPPSVGVLNHQQQRQRLVAGRRHRTPTFFAKASVPDFGKRSPKLFTWIERIRRVH